MKDYKFIGEAVDRLVTVPMSNWTILKGLPLTETYEAARKKGGGDPMTLRAAQLLNERVGKGDTVLLLSGFVILNWNRPETDGPVGVAALARSLDLALGAVPVILTEDILVDNLAKTTESAGMIVCHSEEELKRGGRGRKAMVMGFPLDHEEAKKQAAEILDLTEYLDRKPKALSGGQRQRVAMGRAIVREPKVFLMDEPLSNLDAKLRVQTRTQIAALQRQLGVTTLYVTHDQTEALTMGDRIAVIKLGVLQQVGAPTELYDRPANVFVAGFIGSPSMNINTHPVVNGKAKIGEDTVDLPAEAVNKLTAEDGGKIVVGFRPEDATLATPDDPNAFSLKVQNIEDLGSDGYIYGTIITDGSAAEASTMMSDQNKLTTIRVNPRALPKIGQTVKIKIDPSKMHLFAPSTELRLN